MRNIKNRRKRIKHMKENRKFTKNPLLRSLQVSCPTFRVSRPMSWVPGPTFEMDPGSWVSVPTNRPGSRVPLFGYALKTDNFLQKMTKNAFYFTLKALLILRDLDFCLDVLIM